MRKSGKVKRLQGKPTPCSVWSNPCCVWSKVSPNTFRRSFVGRSLVVRWSFYKNLVSILQILGNLQRFFVGRFCVNSDLIKLVRLLFVCCSFVRSKKIILLSYRKPIIYKDFLFVDFPIFDSTCVVRCVVQCVV